MLHSVFSLSIHFRNLFGISRGKNILDVGPNDLAFLSFPLFCFISLINKHNITKLLNASDGPMVILQERNLKGAGSNPDGVRLVCTKDVMT